MRLSPHSASRRDGSMMEKGPVPRRPTVAEHQTRKIFIATTVLLSRLGGPDAPAFLLHDAAIHLPHRLATWTFEPELQISTHDLFPQTCLAPPARATSIIKRPPNPVAQADHAVPALKKNFFFSSLTTRSREVR